MKIQKNRAFQDGFHLVKYFLLKGKNKTPKTDSHYPILEIVRQLPVKHRPKPVNFRGRTRGQRRNGSSPK